MEEGTPLSGSCSCGRNHFVIYAPSDPLRSLRLLYDERADHGRTLCLRVPVARFQSTTYAFYDDETHNNIRRVFSPRRSPHIKRHFCGFCGTPLSHWSESPPEEADFLFVNLGSLKDESVEKLEEAGIFSEASNNESPAPAVVGDSPQGAVAETGGQMRELRGHPWFEEMIEGSELGRIKRRKGGESSADGRVKVEWEVVEFESGTGNTSGSATSKRKIGNEDDMDSTTG